MQKPQRDGETTDTPQKSLAPPLHLWTHSSWASSPMLWWIWGWTGQSASSLQSVGWAGLSSAWAAKWTPHRDPRRSFLRFMRTLHGHCAPLTQSEPMHKEPNCWQWWRGRRNGVTHEPHQQGHQAGQKAQGSWCLCLEEKSIIGGQRRTNDQESMFSLRVPLAASRAPWECLNVVVQPWRAGTERLVILRLCLEVLMYLVRHSYIWTI